MLYKVQVTNVYRQPLVAVAVQAASLPAVMQWAVDYRAAYHDADNFDIYAGSIFVCRFSFSSVRPCVPLVAPSISPSRQTTAPRPRIRKVEAQTFLSL